MCEVCVCARARVIVRSTWNYVSSKRDRCPFILLFDIIVTRLRTGRTGFNSRQGHGFFSPRHRSPCVFMA
jgi:hypothetical protein